MSSVKVIFRKTTLDKLPVSLPSLTISTAIGRPPCKFSNCIFSNGMSDIRPPHRQVPRICQHMINSRTSSSPTLIPFLVIIQCRCLQYDTVSISHILDIIRTRFTKRSALHGSAKNTLVQSVQPTQFSTKISSHPIKIVSGSSTPFPIPQNGCKIHIEETYPSNACRHIPYNNA